MLESTQAGVSHRGHRERNHSVPQKRAAIQKDKKNTTPRKIHEIVQTENPLSKCTFYLVVFFTKAYTKNRRESNPGRCIKQTVFILFFPLPNFSII